MDSMADTAEIRGARLHFTRLAWRASDTAPAETDILPRSLPHVPRPERFRTKREIDAGAGFVNIGGKQGPFGR